MNALQGLNLGSWLVLERWMIPDVFDGASAKDERGLVAELGRDVANKRFSEHRDSFITEADFQFIAEQGFDFVRLPVGYWLFESTDEYISGEVYVDRAFDWAHKHGLSIVLDLHALQGSQNGKMHSGQIGQVAFYSEKNQYRALGTVDYLATRYGKHPALIGLEVINEPLARLCTRRLHQYYQAAYEIAERSLRSDVKIIVSDAFQPRRLAWELSRRDYGDRLVLDIHKYQVFGRKYASMTFEQHLEAMKAAERTLASIAKRIPILIGEWSGALPGAARADIHDQTNYIELQQTIYAKHAWAEAYWSYKKQGDGAWNARTMIEKNALKPYR